MPVRIPLDSIPILSEGTLIAIGFAFVLFLACTVLSVFTKDKAYLFVNGGATVLLGSAFLMIWPHVMV